MAHIRDYFLNWFASCLMGHIALILPIRQDANQLEKNSNMSRYQFRKRSINILGLAMIFFQLKCCDQKR